MAFGAKFPGRCTAGDAIRVGDRIESSGRRGYRHVGCRFSVAVRTGGVNEDVAMSNEYARRERAQEAAAFMSDPDLFGDRAEMAAARAERDRDNAEYAAGIADGNRYHAEKAVFGAALADKWQAQDEWNRYWKLG